MIRPAPAFYRDDDVVKVSRRLLGKVLCTSIGNATTRAIIVETEAHEGTGDDAKRSYRFLVDRVAREILPGQARDA